METSFPNNNSTTNTKASILYTVLSGKNKHVRDDNVHFDEPTHKYTILNDVVSNYTSVTTFNHQHFAKFDADKIIKNMMKGSNWNPSNKYWGMSIEDIKRLWNNNASIVSNEGTNLHFDIECFMNQNLVDETDNPIPYTHQDLLEVYNDEINSGILPPNTSDEWLFFLKFIEEFPHLKPYRTEWVVYNEDIKLAGSIDMVYENPDGTLSIYDWKRAKEITKANSFNKFAITTCINHLPDTNFWHYSLQLNTYKVLLEEKYGKTVKDLYLVRLHPNNNKKTFDLIKCADLKKEVYSLFEYRKIQLLNHSLQQFEPH